MKEGRAKPKKKVKEGASTRPTRAKSGGSSKHIQQAV